MLAGIRALSVWLKNKRLTAAIADLRQSGGWSPKVRNLSLDALFILLLMFTLPHFIATHSGAYKSAMVTAQRSPLLIGALGAPVTEAWFSEGKEELGDFAKATMVISIRGRNRKGNLYAKAVKDATGWKLTELLLDPPTAKNPHIIDNDGFKVWRRGWDSNPR